MKMGFKGVYIARTCFPDVLSKNMTSTVEIQTIVQSVSRDFHENRSNCDKSVKFGTKLHYIIINQNRPGHK